MKSTCYCEEVLIFLEYFGLSIRQMRFKIKLSDSKSTCRGQVLKYQLKHGIHAPTILEERHSNV